MTFTNGQRCWNHLSYVKIITSLTYPTQCKWLFPFPPMIEGIFVSGLRFSFWAPFLRVRKVAFSFWILKVLMCIKKSEVPPPLFSSLRSFQAHVSTYYSIKLLGFSAVDNLTMTITIIFTCSNLVNSDPLTLLTICDESRVSLEQISASIYWMFFSNCCGVKVDANDIGVTAPLACWMVFQQDPG